MDFRPRDLTAKIILHDSHTPFDLQPSAAAHLKTSGRAMGLLDVGYHFVIERDGKVGETRAHRTVGSHCPGHNHDSIGICLAGGQCGVDDFTADQMDALAGLLVFLKATYGSLRVLGHSELARGRHRDRPCPAFDMDAFRKDYMTDDTVHPSLDPMGTAQPPASRTGPLSEQERVLVEYLRSGRSLTNMVAIMQLGVGSLTSRVAELRRRGFVIKSHEAKDFHERRYIKYTLEGEPDGFAL